MQSYSLLQKQMVKLPVKKRDLTWEEKNKLIQQVGPMHYNLINDKNNNDDNNNEAISFLIFGCQGTNSPTQQTVAELMGQQCAKDPSIIACFGAGDNFYEEGVKSENSDLFKTHFDQIYKNISLPFFMTLGNHCHAFSNETEYKNKLPSFIRTPSEKGYKVAINQVVHTYTEQPAHFYQEKNLYLSELPKWNMPHYFYALTYEKVSFFFLDTSTYVKDFLEFSQYPKKVDKRKNQAAWLEEEYKKSVVAGNKIILIGHHPLLPMGKNRKDAKLYLSEDEIKRLSKILYMPENDKNRYYKLFSGALKKQGIRADMNIAAHDHCGYLFNNIEKKNIWEEDKICEIVTGQGGGDLQKRENFKNIDSLACFLKEHGFVKLTMNPKEPDLIFITFYTTEGKELVFSNQSVHAFHESVNKLSSNVRKLRENLFFICHQYQQKLAEKQVIAEKKENKPSLTIFSFVPNALQKIGHYAHKSYELGCKISEKLYPNVKTTLDIMHDVLNYLNKKTLDPLDVMIMELNKILDQSPDKDEIFYKNIAEQLESFDIQNKYSHLQAY